MGLWGTAPGKGNRTGEGDLMLEQEPMMEAYTDMATMTGDDSND